MCLGQTHMRRFVHSAYTLVKLFDGFMYFNKQYVAPIYGSKYM